MSRFFNALSSSSEDEESSVEVQPANAKLATSTKFLVSDDSGDDSDVKRVVKSDFTKRVEALEASSQEIYNFIEDSNIQKLSSEYDTFTKNISKSMSLFQGNDLPWFTIKTLHDLENYLENLWSDSSAKSLLKKSELKLLVPLRQKVKKNNMSHSNQISKYKADPSSCVDKFLDKEKSSEESEGSDDDDESVSSSSSFQVPTLNENVPASQLRNSFLKKDETKVKKKREKKEKVPKTAKQLEEVEEPEEFLSHFETKLFADEDKVTVTTFLNKVKEIMKTKGKKSYLQTYKNDFLYMLGLAKRKNFEVHIICGLYVELVTSTLDDLRISSLNLTSNNKPYYETESVISGNTNKEKQLDSIMEKLQSWVEAVTYLAGLIKLCLTNGEVKVRFFSSNTAKLMAIFETNYERDQDGYISLVADLASLVSTADEVFINLLNACDVNSSHYSQVYKYQYILTDLVSLSIEYFEFEVSKNDYFNESLCSVYLLQMELSYHKIDNPTLSSTTSTFKKLQTKESLNEFCSKIKNISKNKDTLFKSTLYLVYNLAINDYMEEANSLFKAEVEKYEGISSFENFTQVEYNRTLLQLALCYFRQGFYQSCHEILSKFYSSPHFRDLIGQPMPKTRQKNVRERRYLVKHKRYPVPFHNMINIGYVDYTAMVCSLLIDSPYYKNNVRFGRHNPLSSIVCENIRKFNQKVNGSEYLNKYETIVLAVKAMRNGDWRACYEHAKSIDLSRLCIYRKFIESETFVEKIKEGSLISFLFNFHKSIQCMTVENLCNMFNIDPSKVRLIVNTLIFEHELRVYWKSDYTAIFSGSQSKEKLKDYSNRALMSIEKCYNEFNANADALADLKDICET